MRLFTVLLFGLLLVTSQIFLALKMVRDTGQTDVDVVDTLEKETSPILDIFTVQERRWLENHPSITVGIDPEFYPVEYVDEDGLYRGIGPDYLRLVRKLTGLEFQVVHTPNWSSTIRMGTTRQVDMYIAAAKTRFRSAYMLFTPPYINLPGIIVTRREGRAQTVATDSRPQGKSMAPIPTGDLFLKSGLLKGLSNKRVAVVERYSWHDFLEELHPEIRITPVATTQEGLQKVAFGEVDAMIDYQFNITEKIKHSGILNLRAAGEIRTPYGHAFGIRRDWPELHGILTKALERISPEQRRLIADKWLHPFDEKNLFSIRTLWVLLFAAEAVLAVFAFVLYWNFSLKQQVGRRTAQLDRELARRDQDQRALSESRSLLEQANAELEHRVLERTRDLQDINTELQHAKEAADAATTAKSQFLANISHEIRTPLHGIISFAELALEKENRPPRRALQTILQSSHTLLNIINDLLDVSKIEAGHLELVRAPFMLDDVVSRVCTLAQPEAAAGGVELIVDMEPGMPLALTGDAGRIQQILTNLVANATKFTPEGGTIRISLSGLPCPDAPDTARIVCRVCDTGVGIAPEFQDQLFHPFRQVDASSTRRHGGTGLGLFICRQFVEAMGGDIRVESEPGQGSTFTFSLRLAIQDAPAPCTPSPSAPATLPTAPPKLANTHILVAEDNPTNQEIMEALFEDTGVRLSIVDNGKKAVSTVAREHVDLILMDVQMPIMDGYEATRMIRKGDEGTGLSPSRVPIIAVTAHARQEDRTRALDAGVDLYLSKPLSRQELFQAIRTLLPDKDVSGPGNAEPLPHPSGMDESTMRRLGLSRAAYLKLLRGFVKNTRKTLPALQNLLEEDNSRDLIRVAHNLKGAAANIGASEVHEAARQLEQAARKQDTAAFPELLARTQAAFEDLARTLPDEASPAPLSPESRNSSPENRGDAYEHRAQALKNALDLAAPNDIQRTLTALVPHLPPSEGSRLRELVENYDYDEARDVLDALTQKRKC